MLRDTKSLDESTTASTQTVSHSTVDGSSITSPTSCENLLIQVADSAPTVALKAADIQSLDELIHSSAAEPVTANPQTVPHNTTDRSSNISPSTCEKILRGVSPLEDLLDPTSLEELIAAILPAVQRNTIDGASCTSPSICKKLVIGAAESASAQTLQNPDVSSLDEFLCSSSEELIAASTRTIPHNNNYGSLASASSLGSKILRRSPPNWY
ncbi:hypothetical protein PR202_gb18053 [Eleusine coracana subsp. coracana]|uniref:Uncharacterized protein n=1 Tax=Eleusine coracana subsp. coracana TaxID=191504 RepID=A0AAV5F576_ELECO|nr:hypothetical protein PR202_gb17986 [Eleusine coracana subsp. coracana]GJN29798.1 hypothetical protein PR202_gb18053 [Eleusine coracana subsp. coracana]